MARYWIYQTVDNVCIGQKQLDQAPEVGEGLAVTPPDPPAPDGVSTRWLGDDDPQPGDDLSNFTLTRKVWDDPVVRAATAAELDAFELREAEGAVLGIVDRNTTHLLRKGFSFDGEVFSLSLAAQHNWSYLRFALLSQNPDGLYDAFIDDTGHPDGPMMKAARVLPISKQPKGTYLLAYDSVAAFTEAAGREVARRVGGGAIVKTQVSAASTLAELNAVQDTRT